MEETNKETMVKQSTILALLVIAVFAVGGLLAWDTFGESIMPAQQTAIGTVVESGVTVPVAIQNRATTLSVDVFDYASTTPGTSKVAPPLYVIANPTVEKNAAGDAIRVSGTFAADAATTSATSKTDVTSGLQVGQKVMSIAVNNSFYGDWTPIDEPSSDVALTGEAKVISLRAYTVNSGVKVTMQDDNEKDVVLTPGSVPSGSVNVTLGANEENQLTYIKVENNKSSTAFNLAGFFIDSAVNTNVTTVKGEGTLQGKRAELEVGYAKSNVGLERVSNDDVVFRLSKPILMKEYDWAKFSGIILKADGDGCNAGGENIVFTFFDANWYKSTKENSMKYDVETDASSPADVGAADHSQTVSCTN